MITFQQVSKFYENRPVLQSIDLTINDGECLVLVGKSGSGKTTLLKMINKLVEKDSGIIEIDGQSLDTLHLRQLRLSIGYVLQKISLFPNLTVAENILLIPQLKGLDKQDSLVKAGQLLAKVGLNPTDYLSRYPKDLSGGEAQRIGIVRAIIADPQILLMDEPFSALDAITRKQLQQLTLQLQDELGTTTVFVTHDTDEALKLADRIAVLHQGKIIQVDSPKNILEHPINDYVAELFGGAV